MYQYKINLYFWIIYLNKNGMIVMNYV